MGRRRNSLALLEVIKDRNSINNRHKSTASSSSQKLSLQTDSAISHDQDAITHTTTPTTPTTDHHSITSGVKQTGLKGFGRVLRVPVGFVIVYLGATIVLLVVAYSVGYSRGNYKALDEDANANLGQFNQNQYNAQEQTNNRNNSNNTTDTRENSSNNLITGNNNQQLTQKNNINEPREISNIRNTVDNSNNTNSKAQYNLFDDSRVKGLNYIIIEQFSRDEAIRVAEYLKNNNVDVMVLNTPDRNLMQVVAKQGIPGSRYSTVGIRLKQQIQQLGIDWKNRYGGTKNFDQAYGQLF